MSVRYSGDAEVRLEYDRGDGVYDGRVSDPHLIFDGWVPLNRRFARDPTCSEAYDDAARRLAKLAQDSAREDGRAFMLEYERSRTRLGNRDVGRNTNRAPPIRIRRGYQAPCPLEDL